MKALVLILAPFITQPRTKETQQKLHIFDQLPLALSFSLDTYPHPLVFYFFVFVHPLGDWNPKI